MEDIKGKIKKILELGMNNPNEHEAMAAILKAQELMLKYKIENSDIEQFDDSGKKREIVEINSGIYYSSNWMTPLFQLANVICDHFMCDHYTQRRWNERLKEIVFFGLEDDVRICALIFELVYKEIQKFQNDMKLCYPSGKIRQKKVNSYILGWANGLRLKLAKNKQQVEESYGLVVVKPFEVQEYKKNFKPTGKMYDFSNMIDNVSYYKGKKDGEKFDISDKLDTASNKLDMKN